MGGCAPEFVADWDDVLVAKCLRAGEYETYGGLGFDDSDFGGTDEKDLMWLQQSVVPEDQRDDKEKERFLVFSPRMHIEYALGSDDWFVRYTKYAPGGLRSGTECCSGLVASMTVEKDEQLGEVASYLRACA